MQQAKRASAQEENHCDSTTDSTRTTAGSICTPRPCTSASSTATGRSSLHRNLPSSPEAFLEAVAPYRDDLVVAVECIFTWYWLADLCAREGIAFVLGHALYMKAIHGGKAKNDRIDALKIATLLRGGMLPLAYVYPAGMRATRDLLRRRLHLVRKRGQLLAHIQMTSHQYNLPPLGKRIAYPGNREGVASTSRTASCARASPSISPCSNATTADHGPRAAIWCARPSSTTPTPSTACARSRASARCSPSRSSTRSTTCRASIACSSSPPTRDS